MTEIRQIDFPEKDLPLRADVSLMGQLLGQALVEQHGQELLDQVEAIRTAAITWREDDESNPEELEKLLASLDVPATLRIIKAFSTYLRLTNLAEKTHRIRRRRAYQKDQAAAQAGSLQEVMSSLAAEGVDADRLAGLLEELRIRPVFTAHPTEATRRSFLEKEYSIIHRLTERVTGDLTPQEDQQVLDRIRDAINSAWQTATVPGVKPQVSDELDNVLFYLTDILYRIVPPFHESLEQALEAAYGAGAAKASYRDLLRFGSWVGGDMDGNPNVTGETLLESLATQREAIIRCYLPEVNRLARYLSQSEGVARFAGDIQPRLAALAAELPDVDARIPARHREMPYRCMLKFIAGKLSNTARDVQPGYATPDEFREDLACIARSLEAGKGRHAGLFGVRRLLRKIDTFGFHLATLDSRQDALVHRHVLAELLETPDWAELDVHTRAERLTHLLEGPMPALPRAPLSDQAQETLRVFEAIREGRERFGLEATGLFIISMTQGADDVLSALALARFGGLAHDDEVPLDVAPLLETVDDLDAGPEILGQLLAQPAYRAHLARRGDRQVIMVGYSDSSKDSGIVAARWGLYEAQRQLVEIGRRHDVTVHFFHGRGGTVSRGGGNLVNGIEGAPGGSIGGCLRVTEQGEVINQKYGIRPIALRNLELMTGAVLRHHLADTGQHADDDMRGLMEQLAATARRTFRDMVYGDPAFIHTFRTATPIDVIEQLNIGSRPASRRSGQGIENLRAIPWVFSWAQVRVGFPGVYGIGTALDELIGKHGIEPLRDMLQRWSFFRGMINDVEMVLGKSTLEIGQRYAALAGEEGRPVFDAIDAEFALATRHILALKGTEELLDDQRTLQRNIRLRNPYADPMHLMQIDLLQRWRASNREDDELLRALKSTVTGIALAIQNTG
ncbi:MAG: phosphoenolpyruvate carboxylase [Xanthomonadales bacterium]|jgi:phosphoenolpyruvate carboxylase|nr:phosphoenolpyruvate carboxylase [Xanthomonadales bacterium]